MGDGFMGRLLCVACGHIEAVVVPVSPQATPEQWLRCPKCGPLEQVGEPTGKASNSAQRRRIGKGGAVIRGRPIDNG